MPVRVGEQKNYWFIISVARRMLQLSKNLLLTLIVVLQAEARLAAKRQARAEAREIRMRELERMQRESEDGERVYDAYPSPGQSSTLLPPRVRVIVV